MAVPAPDDTRGIIDPAAMMRHVDFARYPAGDLLNGIVDWFWSVSWSMPDGMEHRQQVLNLPGGNISIGTVDDTGPLEEPGSRIYGVLTGISHRLLVGTGWTVAAKTTTGGLGVLLEASARTATGRELALSRIPGLDDAGLDDAGLDDAVPGGGRDGALVSAVTEASTQQARVDLLRTALDGVARRRDPAALAQAREVARIARIAETDRSVLLTEQLADAAGVSVRTLQRLFSDHVGVSPAWVIRRWRIIEAAERARDAGETTWPGWADLAVELGYSDQSHLVRDMRRHLGTTPTGYVSRRPASHTSEGSALRTTSRVQAPR